MPNNATIKKNQLDQSRQGTMVHLKILVALLLAAAGLLYFSSRGLGQSDRNQSNRTDFDGQIKSNAQQMFEEGRRIFRYDTFGDEVYWTGKLKLHNAIQGSKFGGAGPGVSPKTAITVGLRVDMDEIPPGVSVEL